TFTSSVTTNPFCKAMCSYKFKDISNNFVIEKDEFTVRPAVPFTKTYTIRPRKIGEYIDLYRFELACTSRRTVLCHTSEIPTSRSILITAKSVLTKNEEDQTQELRQELDSIVDRLTFLKSTILKLNNTVNNASIIFIDRSALNLAESNLQQNIIQAKVVKVNWKKQDFQLIENDIKELKITTNITEEEVSAVNQNILGIIGRYNDIIDSLKDLKLQLESLRAKTYVSAIQVTYLNDAINEYNNAVNLLSSKDTIEGIENKTSEKIQMITSRVEQLTQQRKKDVLSKELETDLSYDALCEILDICIPHPTIEQRADETEYSMKDACSDIYKIRKVIYDNISLPDEPYPEVQSFWDEIAKKVNNIHQERMIKYLIDLPEDKPNTELIKEILIREQILPTNEYAEYNLTKALFMELSKKPESCVISNRTIAQITQANISKLDIKQLPSISLNITYEDPVPQCCVFNECSDCCVTAECRNTNFPVIFLHGHAINKETSAEYSLEGFNKIQEQLEQDSYLNAGTITLFTSQEAGELWNMLNTPLALRASYYFDIFKEPENYVVVQAKSESIDTYALRLGELIETIKIKTGKPKVNIIAHSMGSLVARNYLKIQGSDSVNKLIMIGAPNKGITGDILKYCPVIGEGLECRDMNSDSLFINKLNTAPLPKIPITNIIGSGCDMDGLDGDGTVLTQNAYLEGADNHIINGTCRARLKPLHLDLRDIEMYPEVYKIIKTALEE
ncbi:alpha/beta hydrolase, partial [Candidatus Woesearchaeota archaeon]|nr:alpha/beta hydrolase [Candidatus Woesearchaeota archaeon]